MPRIATAAASPWVVIALAPTLTACALVAGLSDHDVEAGGSTGSGGSQLVNLLQNPSFDQWTQGQPIMPLPWVADTAIMQSSNAKDGPYAVEVKVVPSNPFSGIQQTYTYASPTQPSLIQGSMYLEYVSGVSTVQLDIMVDYGGGMMDLKEQTVTLSQNYTMGNVSLIPKKPVVSITFTVNEDSMNAITFLADDAVLTATP